MVNVDADTRIIIEFRSMQIKLKLSADRVHWMKRISLHAVSQFHDVDPSLELRTDQAFGS